MGPVRQNVKMFRNGKGMARFGNKKITVDKKIGMVTVKKGLKKGSYSVKVKVKATGNASFKASKH